MFFLYILKGGRHHGRCAGCLFNGHFPFALTRGPGKIPEENEAFLLGSVCSLLAPEACCGQQGAGHLEALIPREFQHHLLTLTP